MDLRIVEQIEAHIKFVSRVHELNLIRFNGKKNGQYNCKSKYKLIDEMDQYDQIIYKKNEYFENNYFSVQELKKLRLAKKGKKGAKEAKGLDKKSGGAKSIEVMKLEQDEEADFNMEGEEEEEEVVGQLSSRGDVSARGGSSQLGHR